MLVHGGWQVPTLYHDFIQLLETTGFEVSCPLLPSCNAEIRKGKTMYDDAEVVRRQIQTWLQQDRMVTVVGYSYRGAVATEAIRDLSVRERRDQGLQGGVYNLVYMCAFMLQTGESVATAILPRPDPDPIGNDEEEGLTFPVADPIQMFYADVKPTDRAIKAASLQVQQSNKAMMTEVTHEAWRYIPTTYLRALEDNALPLFWQDREIEAVEKEGIKVEVESFSTSHSPYLSMPAEIVGAIERASNQALVVSRR